MLQSLKSRVLLVLVVWLALSHLGGLWLYARKHEEAASLLQDALLAERIALVTRLVEHARPEERESLLKILDSPLVKVIPGGLDRELPAYVEGSRPHQFEHLVGLFLDRPDHHGIKTEHQTASAHNRSSLLAMLSAKLNPEPHHLPEGTLGDILTIGTVTTAVGLSGGGTIAFTNPLLTVSPFSPLKIWAPLAAMLVSVFVSGAWVISRATRPLMHLAKAADRLGTDLRAAPLIESGALEVRTASRAFNVMQDRIQRLVEDRTAFAAALAHDIGTPITRLVSSPLVLVVNPALPVTTVEEFIALAKSRSATKPMTYASAGAGGTLHLPMAMLATQNGATMIHVPYKGVAPLLTDVVSGQVDSAWVAVAGATPFVRDGKIKALVVDAPARARALPAVPVFSETRAQRVQADFYFALQAPAGTAPDIAEKIATSVRRILQDPAFREKYLDPFGFIVVASTPAELADYLVKDRPRQAERIKASGAVLD